MNIIEGTLNIDKKKRVALISARFNHFITDRLVEGAKDTFVRHGGDDNQPRFDTGSWSLPEIPFATR